MKNKRTSSIMKHLVRIACNLYLLIILASVASVETLKELTGQAEWLDTLLGFSTFIALKPEKKSRGKRLTPYVYLLVILVFSACFVFRASKLPFTEITPEGIVRCLLNIIILVSEILPRYKEIEKDLLN